MFFMGWQPEVNELCKCYEAEHTAETHEAKPQVRLFQLHVLEQERQINTLDA